MIREVDAKAEALQAEIGQDVLGNYQGAKGFLNVVAEDSGLKSLVDDPDGKLAEIGRYVYNTPNPAVRITGLTAEQAAQQAWQIGDQFMQQYFEARGFVDQVERNGGASASALGALRLREIEKMVLLQTLDHLWREHLVTLEHLRQVIGFRAYGQRDPLNEYKSEAFTLFQSMLTRLRENVTRVVMTLRPGQEVEEDLMQPSELPPMEAHHIDPSTGLDEFALAEAAIQGGSALGPVAERRQPVQSRRGAGDIDANDPSTWGKVSRNAPCPCGSGKKYKHCHGKHA